MLWYITAHIWKKLDRIFSSLTTILKIYMTLPIKICETVRNFSKLSIIKNKFRSTMLEVRLNYRPWVFGTSIYADLKLERWGRLVWTGPSYTMTADKQHREFTVPVFICKRLTEWPVFCLLYNVGFPFSLYLDNQNNGLENIYIYYLPLFNSVAKNLFWGRKNIGGTFVPLQFA